MSDGLRIRDRLRHVRWIGGGSGAGKSTVARHLARAHTLRLYSTDDALPDHVRRSNAHDHPLLHQFTAMGMDERWVNRPPAAMLETFGGFQGEAFEFIVEDLLALAGDGAVIAEGFRLLPRLVAPLLSQPNQAVWLIPSPEFRRAAFDARGFTWEIAQRTRAPDRALANLLMRDALFTEIVRREAAALHLALIEVDLDLPTDALINRVGEALGFPTA